MTLSQIYNWVCKQKNFENRLTSGGVMSKSCVFWTHGVVLPLLWCTWLPVGGGLHWKVFNFRKAIVIKNHRNFPIIDALNVVNRCHILSQHTDFKEDTTNESVSVACSNVCCESWTLRKAFSAHCTLARPQKLWLLDYYLNVHRVNRYLMSIWTGT